MKILHFRLFQGKHLFAGRSTYLLVKKYWGSSHFPLNRDTLESQIIRGVGIIGKGGGGTIIQDSRVLFSGECLLTVTPEITEIKDIL